MLNNKLYLEVLIWHVGCRECQWCVWHCVSTDVSSETKWNKGIFWWHFDKSEWLAFIWGRRSVGGGVTVSSKQRNISTIAGTFIASEPCIKWKLLLPVSVRWKAVMPRLYHLKYWRDFISWSLWMPLRSHSSSFSSGYTSHCCHALYRLTPATWKFLVASSTWLSFRR